MPVGKNVQYAHGLGKNADYDLIRAVAGGDDFAESLPIEWMEDVIRHNEPSMRISLQHDSIRYLNPLHFARERMVANV